MADKIPNHVCIIPDGNRRWARKKGLAASMGHIRAGAYENLKPLFDKAKEMGVKHVSFWGFSTENWNRDKKERDAIFDVISKDLDRLREDAPKEGICVKHIGRRDRLPRELIEKFDEIGKETKDFSDFTVVFCLDYGGRDEIVRAVRKMVEKGGEVSEEEFVNCLDTAGIPDPDLIVRTSGENRTSGFMPFQGTYAEWVFYEKHFPDFGPEDLERVVKWFGERDRRFGGN